MHLIHDIIAFALGLRHEAALLAEPANRLRHAGGNAADAGQDRAAHPGVSAEA